MARAGILFSDVTRAAEQLKQSGIVPTVDRVRKMMGDTGSKSTIAPMLKQWKDEHQDEFAASNTGLPESILNAVKGVHELIKAESANAIEEMRVVCEQKIISKEAQIATLSKDLGDLATQKHNLEQQLTRISNENSHLHQQLQKANLERVALEQENRGMHNRLGDNEAQLKALHQQLHSARQQFEHFQEASATQRKEDKRQFESRTSHLENELRQINALHSVSQNENVRYKLEIEQLQLSQAKMKEIAQIQLEELSNIDAAHSKAQFKLEEAEHRNNALSMKLKATQINLQSVEIKLAVSSKLQDSLAQQLTTLQQRNSDSEHEKLKLLATLLRQHELHSDADSASDPKPAIHHKNID